MFSHPKLVTREETIDRKRLAPDSFMYPSCSYNTSNGFFVGGVLFKMSRTTVRWWEVLILLCLCRDFSTPPLLDSRHGIASFGFRGSYAGNLGVLARGGNSTNIHLARLIAGGKRAGLDVHDISLASGSADVLGYEYSNCSGSGKRMARIRPVARTVSSRRRISGRVMELVNGHESFLALGNRGVVSVLDASFMLALASYLVSGEPWSTVRMEQRAFGRIPCLLRSDWSLRCVRRRARVRGV